MAAKKNGKASGGATGASRKPRDSEVVATRKTETGTIEAFKAGRGRLTFFRKKPAK